MSDPFEVLRTPPVATNPDPAFAATLRARVARALSPGGIRMTALEVNLEPLVTAVSPAIVPYLIVTDARRALEWYEAALGARRRGEPIIMPDGRIGHSELELSGGLIYIADEPPEVRAVAAPRADEGATVSITAAVGDVDGVAKRAVAAGATLERPPTDNPYGRNAVIRDPFGHRWILSAIEPGATTPQRERGLRQGDITYVSLWVPDVERAEAFFGSVLGWSFVRGGGPQGRQVPGVTPSHGLWGGQERSNLFVCYAVDDIAAAVARVRAAGGQAGEPTEQPYGRTADCVDNQGTAFALHQPAGGGAFPAGGPRGELQGDVVYVTLEVLDSAQARAFYSSVLGWRYSPGRVADGWQVEDTEPLAGIQGGHDRDTALPMYRVDDIVGAVERVRSAGGTATEPEQQPYGVSSECVDDQGTRFYLGQL